MHERSGRTWREMPWTAMPARCWRCSALRRWRVRHTPPRGAGPRACAAGRTGKEPGPGGRSVGHGHRGGRGRGLETATVVGVSGRGVSGPARRRGGSCRCFLPSARSALPGHFGTTARCRHRRRCITSHVAAGVPA